MLDGTELFGVPEESFPWTQPLLSQEDPARQSLPLVLNLGGVQAPAVCPAPVGL